MSWMMSPLPSEQRLPHLTASDTPTFWHTPVGRLVAPTLRRPLICGQTCACSRATDCLGVLMPGSDATREDRLAYWGGDAFELTDAGRSAP